MKKREYSEAISTVYDSLFARHPSSIKTARYDINNRAVEL